MHIIVGFVCENMLIWTSKKEISWIVPFRLMSKISNRRQTVSHP